MIVNITPIIAKNPIGIASFLICPIFNLRPDSALTIIQIEKNFRATIMNTSDWVNPYLDAMLFSFRN
jgi:hypothetical protein